MKTGILFGKYRFKIAFLATLLAVGLFVGLASTNKTMLVIPIVLVLVLLLIRVLRSRRRMVMLFASVVFNSILNSMMLQYGLIQRHTLPSTLMYFAPTVVVILSMFFGAVKRRAGVVEYLGFSFLAWMLCMIVIAKFTLMPLDPKVLVVACLVTPIWIYSYYAVYRSKYVNFNQFVKLIAWMSIIITGFGVVDVVTGHRVLGILGLGQTMSLNNVGLNNLGDTSYYEFGIPRMLSVFGSALSVGNWVCSALPILVEATLRTRKRFFLLATVCCIIASVLSLTRASWVSIVIGACAALVLSGHFSGKFKFIVVSIPIILVAVLSTLSNVKIENFINSSINGTDSSSVYHLMGIRIGLSLMWLHPVAGLGTSDSPFFSLWSPLLAAFFGLNQGVDVESAILDLGIQLGIVGIILFFLFIVASIVGASYDQDRLRKFTVVWLSTTILINANVNQIFYDSISALLMFGFFALSRLECENRTSNKTELSLLTRLPRNKINEQVLDAHEIGSALR